MSFISNCFQFQRYLIREADGAKSQSNSCLGRDQGIYSNVLTHDHIFAAILENFGKDDVPGGSAVYTHPYLQ